MPKIKSVRVYTVKLPDWSGDFQMYKTLRREFREQLRFAKKVFKQSLRFPEKFKFEKLSCELDENTLFCYKFRVTEFQE